MDNVSKTRAALEEEIASANAAEEALRRLLDDGGEAAPEEIRDAVTIGFFHGSEFAPEMDVYEDLKNSGELALLSSEPLRRSLSRLDASLRKVDHSLADMLSVQQRLFDTYAAEHMDLRSLFPHLERLDLPEPTGPTSLAFRSDVRFLNLVVFKLDLLSLVQDHFGAARTALDLAAEDLRAARDDP